MKMKSGASSGGIGARGSGSGGSLVIEARSRKARRKEQRQAKKRQPPRRGGRAPTMSAPRQAGTAKVPTKDTMKKTSGDLEGVGDRKRVKFSGVVREKTIPSAKNAVPTGLKSRRKRKRERRPPAPPSPPARRKDRYEGLDDETAAALRRDDAEIAYLEASLGVRRTDGGGGAALNREYAKNEGFGDDFGDFLLGLDDLVERCVGDAGGVAEGGALSCGEGGGGSESEDDHNDSDESENGSISNDDESDKDDDDDNDDTNVRGSDGDSEGEGSSATGGGGGDDAAPYAHLDDDTALLLRQDDAEIERLEQKLGLRPADGSVAPSAKARKKLHREFSAAFQGYGEDFGEFLEGLERIGEGIGAGSRGDDDSSREGDAGRGAGDSSDSEGTSGSGEGSSDGASGAEEERAEDVADHDAALTYRPAPGEDIYGNRIDSANGGAAKTTKYVPPHLRKKREREAADVDAAADADDDAPSGPPGMAADPATIERIRRALNNCLNRLSEHTLESVAKSAASLYSQYPFHDVNDCLWANIQRACVPPHMVMSGLTPLYVGAVAGIHWLGGDGIQLGGHVVEWSVKKLCDALARGRTDPVGGHTEDERDASGKEAANFLLIVCYLYNYGVVHCSLVYDLVRDFVESFTEVDVESLLIVLRHSGPQLRADDPSALKEIILLVKDRSRKARDAAEVDRDRANAPESSRIQYLVDAVLELRNNKVRKQDAALREKTAALKRHLGRTKAAASRALAGKKGGSCLRVTLRDLLEADTKGRWWLVGASWAGNQYRGEPSDDETNAEDGTVAPQDENQPLRGESSPKKVATDDSGLLSLAAAQRMNSDARRAIFCIVMGSSDCDDAFEKLVRQGMLRPKLERDVIRVIVHCCGAEQDFNPFYAHLAQRVCDFQPKSRYTTMLAYWDAFKQLESFSVRKVANLAKLLAHLMLGTGDKKCVTIGVMKRIEFSPTDMPEILVIFLTIFMTTLFKSCEVKSIEKIFSYGAENIPLSRKKKTKHLADSDESDDGTTKVNSTKKEDLSELRESLSIFLLQYLKSSPENIEGSKFHSNLSAAIETCDGKNINVS